VRTSAQAGILCDARKQGFWFDRVNGLSPAPRPISAQRVNASSASFSNPASWKRITGSVLFPRLLETWMVGSVERKDIIEGGRKHHGTKKKKKKNPFSGSLNCVFSVLRDVMEVRHRRWSLYTERKRKMKRCVDFYTRSEGSERARNASRRIACAAGFGMCSGSEEVTNITSDVSEI